jgi:hypothetical protein
MYHIKNQEKRSPSTPIAQSSSPLPSLKTKLPGRERKSSIAVGLTAEATFMGEINLALSSRLVIHY